MRLLYLFIILSSLCSSCATIFKRPLAHNAHREFVPSGHFSPARKTYMQPKVELLLRPFTEIGDIYLPGVTERSVCDNSVLGVNYFATSHRSYSLEGGYAAGPLRFGDRFYSDSLLPIREEYKISFYAMLQQHSVFGRFDVGYGVCLHSSRATQYMVLRPFSTSDNRDSIVSNIASTAWGLGVSADYRITRSFHAEISYKQFLLASDGDWGFSNGHMIFAGVSWRIPLVKNGKKQSLKKA